MRLLGLAVGVCLGLASCSVQTRDSGQSCQRTAQCRLGLACVAGKCTTDLRSVAEHSTVPELAGMSGGAGTLAGAGGAAAGGGGVGAGGAGRAAAAGGAAGSGT